MKLKHSSSLNVMIKNYIPLVSAKELTPNGLRCDTCD